MSTRSASTASPIRLGLVGLGAMADNLFACLERIEGVKLTAVCEPRDERRNSVAKTWGVNGYNDYSRMLEAEPLDLVYIASPNGVHRDQAVAAIERGLPLILQKPMAADLQGCRDIINAWRANPVFLHVGFELRVSRMFRRVRELIDEGHVGEVRNVSVNYHGGLWPDWFPSVNPWRHTRAGTGGMFAEKLCHSIDLIRHWSGSEFDEVTVYRPVQQIVPYFDIADTIQAIFRLRNGGTAGIAFSFTRAAAIPFDPGPANYDPHERAGHSYDFTVLGSGGSIWLNVDRKFLTLVKHKIKDGEFMPSIERVEDFSAFKDNKDLYHDNESELRIVLDRVARGGPPPIHPEDAYRSMEATYLAQQSEDTQCVVRFAEHADQGGNWPPQAAQ